MRTRVSREICHFVTGEGVESTYVSHMTDTPHRVHLWEMPRAYVRAGSYNE